MKLQDQVCTLEQAKRLKELGLSQNSYFSWCGEEGQRLMDNGRDGLAVQEWVFVANTEPVNNMQADHRENVPGAKPFAAAYTVAELGLMLPLGWHTKTRDFDHADWWAHDHDDDPMPPGRFKTEAEARAEALIYCINRGLITIDQINKSITQ